MKGEEIKTSQQDKSDDSISTSEECALEMATGDLCSSPMIHTGDEETVKIPLPRRKGLPHREKKRTTSYQESIPNYV